MPHPVTCYRIPPTGSAPDMPDMTSMYRDTIIKGLTVTGQVHPTKFWRLPTLGDTQVFRGSREPSDRIRAAVALLWDFSSSQKGYRTSLIHSMQMIAPAMQRLDISLWSGAYTSSGNQNELFEVKGWNDVWDHRRANTLAEICMGGTPTGVALHYVRRFVISRSPLPRRLVLVCTDGESDDESLVRREVRLLRGAGVRVCGLYVGGGTTSEPRLRHEYGQHFAFDAGTRRDIPIAFNRILQRLR